MVFEGQVFKSYRELCKAMGEKPLGGNQKKSQLRKWSCLFSWHTEKYKYIIDKVFEDGEIVEFRGCNNDTPHVDVMIPYVRSRIMVADPDEYLGTQRLLSSVLRFIPIAAYKQLNDRGIKSEDFYKKHGLIEIGCFEEYVSVASMVMKDTVIRCLRRMQKNKEIQFTESEVFIAKDGRRRYLCLDGYDELVKQVEYDVCNQMAAELGKKTRGRQLIHYIKSNRVLMEDYYSRCMSRLLQDESLVEDLKNQYLLVGPGRPLKLENVCEYYKVIHIIDYDEERIERARGPDYDEDKQLKAIFEDIKPRVAARVSSSRKDIETIERMLFS